MVVALPENRCLRSDCDGYLQYDRLGNAKCKECGAGYSNEDILNFWHYKDLRCPLCNQGVDKDDKSTWKEVRGWVGGPRKDSMRLRKDIPGRFAHEACVMKLVAGQAADQEDIFHTSDEPAPKTRPEHLGGLFND